jgi:predicted nucleic-acid-binding protein
MPALDTNVLVRLIVHDDVTQQAAARHAIAAVVGTG